jgi:Tfp pilus assembly pilus retraction ATPase PilT
MIGTAGHPQPDPRKQDCADQLDDPDRPAYGMQTLDQCLQELVRRNIVAPSEARQKAASKDAF